MVMMVLLNDAWTWAMPSATFLRTFLLTRRAALLAGDLAIVCSSYVQGLLLQRRGTLARTLAGACVGAGALAAHRQTATMAEAAVAAQVHQTLDVHRGLATQVTLDRELAHFFPDLLQVAVGQVLDLLVEGDANRRADLLRGRAADAEDVGQADLRVLLRRNVDTSNTCHGVSLDSLSAAGDQPWRCL